MNVKLVVIGNHPALEFLFFENIRADGNALVTDIGAVISRKQLPYLIRASSAETAFVAAVSVFCHENSSFAGQDRPALRNPVSS
jgi:hypothetical protein